VPPTSAVVENTVAFCEIASAAQRFVGEVDPVDFDLITVKNKLVPNLARIKNGFTPAPTNGFEFFEAVRHLEKATTSWKRNRLKVGPDSVREHGNVFENRDAQEVINLHLGQELSFINQKRANIQSKLGDSLLTMALKIHKNVGVGGKREVGVSRESQTRHNRSITLRIN